MHQLPATDQTSPLYVRLKRAIRDEIATTMRPGDAIPSEQDLIREYGVSRTTVRLALAALASEGLIVRHQGRGSFVAEAKSTVPHAFGLLPDGRAGQNFPAESTLISHDVIEADTHTSGALGLRLAADVHRIRWTESLTGAPQSYRVSYLPAASFPDLGTKHGTLLDLREALEAYSRNTSVGAETFEVVLADPFRSNLLNVAEGSPLLLAETLICGQDGAPLELARAFYSGHTTRLKLSRLTAAIEPAV